MSNKVDWFYKKSSDVNMQDIQAQRARIEAFQDAVDEFQRFAESLAVQLGGQSESTIVSGLDKIRSGLRSVKGGIGVKVDRPY
jgi:hypothetical protein